MRVTQSMLTSNMLRNLSNSYDRMGKLQEQISTQKKFSKPSDNPVAVMMGMNYRKGLNQVQQFSQNIGEVKNWVDSTDGALDQATSVLQRIRELTVQASNGTLDADQRKSINEEVKQLKEQLVNIGDTQIGDKYIFNGQQTNVRPSDTGNYGSGTIELEVFSGIKLQVNTDGSALFGDLKDPNGSINKLIAGLENNDPSIGNMLSGIDDKINQVLTVRAQVGARQNRVELMEDRLSQQETFATQVLSKNEDIDIEKAIMDLTTQESVQKAALSVGARIIQPSLMDFLR
ncbi:flagellar hook-associated protein FlgL [Bacillus sp. MUM 13]|uniref:flagellar hook-associated protein FlgL n=1 Tax=Bacillus sp. MUM 13 TaxID=1678001 RepID=UPI0008F5DCB9|nr:flagellar hook-associated protein FlgL [Bacillus sp. MUM 13]OIK11429.1 flagellar hook-associated protein FlgL [Bacillus sp. MUM 13]